MRFIENIYKSISSNSIFRAYDIYGHPFKTGTDSEWEVYSAKNKKTLEEASVFVLDKKIFDRLNMSKESKQNLIDIYIYGIRCLETFNHSNILKIVHPISESKDMVAFAAEPCETNIDGSKLEQKEITLNFYQVLGAVNYINTAFGMCVGYVSNGNILVTIDGSWKLCCLNFLSSVGVKNERLVRYCQTGKKLWQLRAPELTNEFKTDFSSDVFAICGCFLFQYAKENRELSDDFFKPDSSSRLLRDVQSTSSLFYNYTPKPLIDAFVSSFSTFPNVRTTIPILLKNSAFDFPEVLFVKSLNLYHLFENKEKNQLIDNFERFGNSISKKYVYKKIIPMFLEELAHTNRRFHALRMLFIVLSLPDLKTEIDTIFSKISFLFGDDDKNIKLLLLNNFILLLQLSDGKNNEKLSRLLKSGLLCKDPDVQTSSLVIIRDNCNDIFFSSTASDLYPALKECAFKSIVINVQVNSIISLSKLLKYIKDKIKLDDMIRQLCSLSTTEPATALSLLGALQSISKYCRDNIDPTILATVVVPYILKNTQIVKLNESQLNMHFKIIDHFLLVIKEKTLSSIQSNHVSSIADPLQSVNKKTLNTFDSKCFTSTLVPTTSHISQPIMIPLESSIVQPSNITALKLIENDPKNYFNSYNQIFQNQDFSSKNVTNEPPNYNALHEYNSNKDHTPGMNIYNFSVHSSIANQNLHSTNTLDLTNQEHIHSPQKYKSVAKQDTSFLNFDKLG